MAQKPVLGKGLASLLPGAGSNNQPAPPPFGDPGPVVAGATSEAAAPASVSNSLETGNRDRHPGIAFAQLEEIVTNPFQPRRDFDQQALEELSASIQANGIIQPLVVRRSDKGYELIAGERRLRAAKLAGLKQVPIVVRKSTDRESLEIALVENIQRQNLNCIDEALAYQQLMDDFNLTQEEAAKRVGKERATVANYLRLLKLPEALVDDLRRQVLTFGHGKALLGLEDNDQRLLARAEVIEKRLSVRDTEGLVDRMKKGVAASGEPGALPPPAVDGKNLTPVQQRLSNLSQSLTRLWSSRVEIKGSDRKGKLVFHYANRQELERLLQSLQNPK